MGLFSKKTFKVLSLPVKCYIEKEDKDSEFLSFEAYGDIFGEYKYCSASFGYKDTSIYDDDTYYQMIEDLTSNNNACTDVTFKYKNDELKDFEFDINSLADAFHEERLRKIELLSWGMSDKSHIE